MPRLAIVISAVGSIESLERTLVSVLENRPADSEILVALNQPYADPYDLKEEVRFLTPVRRDSAVAGIQRALAATRAPFVHLLASGCLVTEGWADEALARFGDRSIASVAPLVWDAEHRQRIFAAGVGYRPSGRRFLVGHGLEQLSADAHDVILGACEFAAFYRKAALDSVGGLSLRLGVRQAGIDLAFAFKRAGFGVAVAPQSRVVASAEVEQNEGAFRQALHDERLFWRNVPSAGRISALAAHAGLVAIELLCSFGRPRLLAQLAARALGCIPIGRNMRHRQTRTRTSERSARSQTAHQQLRVDRSHDVPTHSDSNQARVPSN